ncbi:MAG: hypothetical protein M0R80_13280 [Proteobacteria bacterium]|jgi:hypothetical protein|nr:hypothetical protein [Pseudomonadota bacterium]
MIPQKWHPISIAISICSDHGETSIITIDAEYLKENKEEQEALDKLWEHVTIYYNSLTEVFNKRERNEDLQEYKRLKKKLGI